MEFDQALAIANAAMHAHLGRYLSDVETAILRGSWDDLTYEQIAESSRYSISYVRRHVGAQFWKLLSQALGEPVSKTNFRMALERRNREQAAVSSPTVNSQTELHIDWGEALDVSVFYGRESEIEQLTQWVLRDRCQLIALLGMGGIGKTALSVKLAQGLIQRPEFKAQRFEYVIWRSLRNAPSLETLLADLVPFLSNQQDTRATPERLLHWLRSARCFIILDNVESILQAGDCAGYYQQTYESYGEFFSS